MDILVTGAKGFIGKNLVLRLKELGHNVLCFDIENTEAELVSFVKQASFIFHLAGINRPLTEEEFVNGNVNFTKKLLDIVEKENDKCPIVFTSSTQAEKDNPYGLSKKRAEEELFAFEKTHSNPVRVFRLANVFGKWCRPNYNSVIATWCYNISHDLEVQINKEAPAIEFVYIDDVCSNLISMLKVEGKDFNIHYVSPSYKELLVDIYDLLISFKESKEIGFIPRIETEFGKKLYSTYLSYIDIDKMNVSLETHEDHRGSFTELLKSNHQGQVSINIAKPGITKGNHYHHTKNEKYIVIKGTCRIDFRKVGEEEITSYVCSGDKMEIIDIPPGYTHSITNIGEEDSYTIMWANELLDKENPDTIYEPVERAK